MNQEEKLEEMLDKIRKSAAHVPAPEGLEPEAMMAKLELMEKEELRNKTNEESEPIDTEADRIDEKDETENGFHEVRKTGQNQESKNNRRKHISRYGLIAAAFLMAVIGYNQIRSNVPSFLGTDQISGETQAAPPEAAAETTTGEFMETEYEAEPYAAESYDDIYQELEKYKPHIEPRRESSFWDKLGSWWGGSKSVQNDMMVAETTAAAADNGPSPMAPVVGGAGNEEQGALTGSDKEFSDTNIQVEGVDEGDIVKTDGSYIYVADVSLGIIKILKADGADIMPMGTITGKSGDNWGHQLTEFYINGDKLSLIRQSFDEAVPLSGYDEDMYMSTSGYGNNGKSRMVLETYDISDKSSPKLKGSIVQDGNYQSSRRVGDYVYLTTLYSPDWYRYEMKLEDCIPKVNDSKIPFWNIYMPDNINGGEFVVITTIDMNHPDETVEQKAVMASGHYFYMSQENIYIGSDKYDGKANQYNYTELLKLSYKDGNVKYKAHCYVDGYLNDQFSMDEYQGNLRLVSTLSHMNGISTNSLFVLDKDLKQIGKIENLAPGEMVYSSRFMGDIGYFVTFRNMDPLFSVDLSDPAYPKILGELKITGFSEYLHFYSDQLLFGIGREIHPETGNFQGLKLSMFDIKDPYHVTEIDKTVVREYEHSPAWSNHKAVLISPSKNLIGFAVENYNTQDRSWTVEYVVYSYEPGKGFKQHLAYPLDSMDSSVTRGLFIGDWFYIVENNKATAFTLAGFEQMGQAKY